MHLHWKYRELVKIIVKGKSFAQVKQIAIALEAESGGVLVSLDETPKGIAIIVYRGKNYIRPLELRPGNLLTRRQALARSIELQRREVASEMFLVFVFNFSNYNPLLFTIYFVLSYFFQALKHHILDLEERVELVKSELVCHPSLSCKILF